MIAKIVKILFQPKAQDELITGVGHVIVTAKIPVDSRIQKETVMETLNLLVDEPLRIDIENQERDLAPAIEIVQENV